jgi:hypothetical protein
VQTLTAEAREQLRQRSLQVHAQFAARVGKDYLQRSNSRKALNPSNHTNFSVDFS